MSSVRIRALATGTALALAAFVLTAWGDVFGADLPKAALLGVATGAVLGLVPDRSPAARIGGFLFGFGAAWLGYALRAGWLPDTSTGRAIAAVIVVAVVTVIAVATANRLPMWAGFVGVATLVGAYETTFNATPTGFVADSTTAATASLLPAALAFLVAVLAGGTAGAGPTSAAGDDIVDLESSVPAPRAAADAAADSNVSVTKKATS
jgi:hypothetical protein